MISQRAVKNFKSYMRSNEPNSSHAFDGLPSPLRGSGRGVPLSKFEKGGIYDEAAGASAAAQRLLEFLKANVPPVAVAETRGLVKGVVDLIDLDERDESEATVTVTAADNALRFTPAPDLPHADRLGRPFTMDRRR